MKKITFLIFLLSAYLGYAQPTTNASDPTQDSADVISIYSDAYTDVATNYDPNWGQSGHTLVNPSYDPGTGNLVLAYPNFNYQGTDITTQNAAAMEFLHVDLWTNADPSATDIQVSPINNGTGTGELLVSITYTSGTWTSVDIPKSAFTGMTWDSVFQLKFAANGPGSTVPVDIYLDNIYFWKNAVDPTTDATLSDLQVDGMTVSGFSPTVTNYTYGVPLGSTVVPQITTATTNNTSATTSITQASAVPGDATVLVTAQDGTTQQTYTVSFVFEGPGTAAPTPPARAASDVISLFSDAYSNVNVTEWSTTWDDSSIEDIMVDGNPTKKVTFTNFLGVEFDNFDATAMTHFHIDIFTDETDLVGKVFNPKWSHHGGVGSEQSAFTLTWTTFSTGTWISIDVPLTDFDNPPQTRFDLSQFIVTSNLGVVYFDNLYLHKNTTLDTQNFEISKFNAYPNPTKNVWNISGNQTIESVLVYDVLGKQVMEVKPNNTNVELDASTLPNGLYFARLTTEFGSNSIKLIKN